MAKPSLKFATSSPTKPPKPMRAWQRMLSGRRLDLLNPASIDIELEDIAHGLSRMSRWNGQTKGVHCFSVAAHSLLVEAIFSHLNPKASTEHKMVALLHDAPEYVIGDLISPFKAAVGIAYAQLEDRLLEAIYRRFLLPPILSETLKKQVKRADLYAAALEALTIAGFEAKEVRTIWKYPPQALIDLFEPKIIALDQSNETIKQTFIRQFNQLELSRRMP